MPKPTTIRIKPRAGVALAGIPAAGADVPAELAEEWIAAKLATRVTPTPVKPATPAPKSSTTEG